MTIAETDLSTLSKLNHSGMEVVTYKSAHTKQVWSHCLRNKKCHRL